MAMLAKPRRPRYADSPCPRFGSRCVGEPALAGTSSTGLLAAGLSGAAPGPTNPRLSDQRTSPTLSICFGRCALAGAAGGAVTSTPAGGSAGAAAACDALLSTAQNPKNILNR